MFAKIYMLHEIPALLADAASSSSAQFEPILMRVTGFVEFLDVERKHCSIVHKGSRLWVDVSCVDYSILSANVVVQFIGALKEDQTRGFMTLPPPTAGAAVSSTSNDEDESLHPPLPAPPPAHFNHSTSGERQFYLAATLIRVVQGLDLELFEQALLEQRKFVNSIQH